MRSTRQLIHDNRENFPVASWLLPRALRADVMTVYAFARYADTIADDPTLSPEEKVQRLEALRAPSSSAPDWVRAMYRLCDTGRCRREDVHALLDAFMQDTHKARYYTWEELIDYSRRSAAPIGRIVLDLAGETIADRTAADALCMALQILNHLQDAAQDYRVLDRVYLPADMMERRGAKLSMLLQPLSPAPLSGVYRDMLCRIDVLLAAAGPLAGSIRSRRLRWEVRAIRAMAMTLSRKLRHELGLATGRVTLTRKERWRAVAGRA